MAAKKPPSRAKSPKPQKLTNWERLTDDAGNPFTVWTYGRLYEYLERLASALHRLPPDWPQADFPREVNNAKARRFNPHHIVLILSGAHVNGMPGPWFVPERPIPNLVMADALMASAAVPPTATERRARKAAVQHNRRLTSLTSRLKSMRFPKGTEDRIRAAIQAERHHVSQRIVYAPGLGVTVKPGSALTRHRVWQWCILHLVGYLRRSLSVSQQKAIAITAGILHAASDGRYPDNPQKVRDIYFKAQQRLPD